MIYIWESYISLVSLSSPLSFLKMANTRNANANANANNNNQQAPTIEQLMALQAQILQTMQQSMAQMQQQGPQPQCHDKLSEFQRTNPPTFSHSVEPMDADDWLHTIEKKLHVVQCTNREKVLYASHQLQGPAAEWWDAYVAAHEEPESINW